MREIYPGATTGVPLQSRSLGFGNGRGSGSSRWYRWNTNPDIVALENVLAKLFVEYECVARKLGLHS